MSITSQLPPIVLAQASSSLRALAQAAGQTLEARVLVQNANGTTQVQIGRQVLSLTLPQEQPAGTTLTLSVQQSDGQLRLSLVGIRPPEASAPAAPSSGALSTPATSVHLSAAALSVPTPAQILPGQGSAPPIASPGLGTGAASGSGQGDRALRPAQPYGPLAAPRAGAEALQSTVQPSATGTAPAVAPVTSSSATVAPASSIIAGPAVPVPTASTPAPVVAGPAIQLDVPSSGPLIQSSASPPVALATPRAEPYLTQQASAPMAEGSRHMPAGKAAFGTMPYGVAPPTSTPAAVTGVGRSAATALPPIAQAVSSSVVGQHAPAPNMEGGVVSAPTAPVAAASAGPAAPTPQAVLAQMVQQALPRQDSILGLTTALNAIAGKVALPEPVAKAAQQILTVRLPLDGSKIGGDLIRSAMQQSGIFQEAMLAAGQAPVGDLKGALLSMRMGLINWLGHQAPVVPVGAIMPPVRGQVPRARAGEGSSGDMPDDPIEVGKLLFERTDAALSRLRLHQNASLPDPGPARHDAQWSMDLPVVIAGHQHLLQLQIQRDSEKEAERDGERSWQVRFAINLAERGEVGAQISLRARNTSVLIWADDPSTAAVLASAVEDLREEIAGVGLAPGAIVVRAGAPAVQPFHPAGSSGHAVDATR